MTLLRTTLPVAILLLLPIASAAPIEVGGCATKLAGHEACAFFRIADDGNVLAPFLGDPGAGDIVCVQRLNPDPWGTQFYDECCYFPPGSTVATYCWDVWYS